MDANMIRRSVVAAAAASAAAHEAWRTVAASLGGGHPLERKAAQAADLAADNSASARRLWMAFQRSRGMMGGGCGLRGCSCGKPYAPLTHIGGFKDMNREAR